MVSMASGGRTAFIGEDRSFLRRSTITCRAKHVQDVDWLLGAERLIIMAILCALSKVKRFSGETTDKYTDNVV